MTVVVVIKGVDVTGASRRRRLCIYLVRRPTGARTLVRLTLPYPASPALSFPLFRLIVKQRASLADVGEHALIRVYRRVDENAAQENIHATRDIRWTQKRH